MPKVIMKDSVVVAAGKQVATDLSGETVILQLSTGKYYGLDSVGTGIWQMLQSPVTVSELRDSVLEKYDVASDRCEHDLLALLGELASSGLILVRNGPRD